PAQGHTLSANRADFMGGIPEDHTPSGGHALCYSTAHVQCADHCRGGRIKLFTGALRTGRRPSVGWVPRCAAARALLHGSGDECVAPVVSEKITAVLGQAGTGRVVSCANSPIKLLSCGFGVRVPIPPVCRTRLC